MKIRTAAAAAALLLAHRSEGQARAFVSSSSGAAPRQGHVPPRASVSHPRQHHHHHHHRGSSMMSAGLQSSYCRGGGVAPRISFSWFAAGASASPPRRSTLLSRSARQRQRYAPVGTGTTLGRGEGRGAGSRGTTRLLSMRESGQGGGGKGESVQNRALGTVVYLLPILDGLEFGRDLFDAVPPLGTLVHGVLSPFMAVWNHVPFMPLVMFIILQISVRRQDTSRFIRFNVQQAILVDILTVVLGLLGTAAGYVMPEGEQFMTNFAFYCLVGAVAYAVAETARGRKANQIPLISAAAEIQLGPS